MLKTDTKLTLNVKNPKPNLNNIVAFIGYCLLSLGKNNGWRGGVKMSKTPHKDLLQL